MWELDLDAGLRTVRLGVETHLITSHCLLPLLVTRPGGLLVEVTDGTAEFNAQNYRISVFYDLAKVAVNRIAFSQGHDLAPFGATAVAVTPGWLRSEMMLDNYVVTESNWRAAMEPRGEGHPIAPGAFTESETPRFVGRGVAAIAADPDRARWNQRSASSAELAREYGFTDVDGRAARRLDRAVDIFRNLFTFSLTLRARALFTDGVTYDTIIRNGRWFDGTGAASAVRNLGIRNGHVVAISADELDETGCPQVIDATGKWVLPGMLDIHTHYDVEVLDGPALSESLRHGVTTVMLGSCSLSTIHVDGTEAGDLFGRVEAIPREHVIAAVDEHKTWPTCDEYVEALEALPLGPNLAAFIGHSDMRTAVMGLDRATRKDERPTRGEQAEMERMLTEALKAGFVGMSSMQLLFDKLDGDTCRSRTLPSTYAKPRELRRLKSLLRKAGRVLQSGPTSRTR